MSFDQKVGNNTVLDILREKHPPPSLRDPSNVIQTENPKITYHSSIFESTNTDKSKQAALKTHGSHGRSGLDANKWRRLFTSFDASSADLFKTVAKIGYKIATETLPPKDLVD